MKLISSSSKKFKPILDAFPRDKLCGHPSASIFDGSCSIGLIPLPVTFRFATCFSDLTQKEEEPPPKITIEERIANMPAAHHGMMLNAPNEIAMPKIRSFTNIGMGLWVFGGTPDFTALRNKKSTCRTRCQCFQYRCPPQHDHNPNRNRRVCRGGKPLRYFRLPFKVKPD